MLSWLKTPSPSYGPLSLRSLQPRAYQIFAQNLLELFLILDVVVVWKSSGRISLKNTRPALCCRSRLLHPNSNWALKMKLAHIIQASSSITAIFKYGHRVSSARLVYRKSSSSYRTISWLIFNTGLPSAGLSRLLTALMSSRNLGLCIGPAAVGELPSGLPS